MTTTQPTTQHVQKVVRFIGKWNGVDVEIKHFDAKDERVYVEVVNGIPGYELIVHPASITEVVAT